MFAMTFLVFDTRKRELEGLDEAMKKTGLQKSILVTMDEEGEENMPHGTVQVMLAREFLLNNLDEIEK